MSTAAQSVLVTVTALGSATVGGVFFAFDAFVLHALAALPDGRGAQAMRSINVSAVRPALMIALFGTAALAVGVGVLAVQADDSMRGVLLGAGAAAYLFGTLLTTMVRNVPLNNALAAADGAAGWAGYLVRWRRANRLRMVFAIAAAAVLLAGLLR
ncbi:anthrone oxygenase family protein [Nakamurella sp. GG22]